MKHLNQVAELTAGDIKFLKAKFVSSSGWEMVTYPIERCARAERPITILILGALLVALAALAALGIIFFGIRLEPESSVPVGAVLVAGAVGLFIIFRSRRHHLIFTMRDGLQL